MAKSLFLKNESLRLMVVLGVNCLPGKVTTFEVEDEDLLRNTVKGVEGLKFVKGKASSKVVEKTEPVLDVVTDTDEDEIEDETKDENSETSSSNGNQNSGSWNATI